MHGSHSSRGSALPNLNPRIKAMQRMWLGYKSDCEVDAAGRVVLTPEMRDYAKLDRKVQMIGQGTASSSGANAAGGM